jgi:tetrahydromethanopterin S-methyltransferase subunit B
MSDREMSYFLTGLFYGLFIGLLVLIAAVVF